jgi:hypothetical protein
MMDAKVMVHLTDLPEVMASLRREMANVLRDAARDGCAPEDAKRYLLAAADTFEGHPPPVRES